MQLFLLISIFFSFNVFAQNAELNCSNDEDMAFDKSDCRIEYYNQTFREQCISISDYHVKNLENPYQVECHYNYHHYNSTAYTSKYSVPKLRERIKSGKVNPQVRLGGFNMLHPMNGKTRFKDLDLVAKVINTEFDVLAGIELIPVTMDEYKINNGLHEFILEKQALIDSGKISLSEIKTTKEDIKKAKAAYYIPGYVEILNKLRKLDDSWALILSPRAESAKPSDQKEFVGFYYRASKVRPTINDFCSLEKVERKGNLFGCIPFFYDVDLFYKNGVKKSKKAIEKERKDDEIYIANSKEKSKAFSRRPFIASFKSLDFEFTMVASHVVFTSPSDPQLQAEVISPAFDKLSSYDQIKAYKGVTKTNFARWAEVRLTLELVDYLKTAYDQKVIYVADFNLEKDNPHWEEALEKFPGGEVYIDEKTSIDSENGYASNYDHFVFNPNHVKECVQNDGTVKASIIDVMAIDQNYYIYKYMQNKYVNQTQEGVDAIWKEFITPRRETLRVEGQKEKVLKKFMIEKEDDLVKSFAEKLVDRGMALSGNAKYYPDLIVKTFSDHVPVKISCRIQ